MAGRSDEWCTGGNTGSHHCGLACGALRGVVCSAEHAVRLSTASVLQIRNASLDACATLELSELANIVYVIFLFQQTNVSTSPLQASGRYYAVTMAMK